MKLFVVVNKSPINQAYIRYGTNHTPIQHTLSHKNHACFEELVHFELFQMTYQNHLEIYREKLDKNMNMNTWTSEHNFK